MERDIPLGALLVDEESVLRLVESEGDVGQLQVGGHHRLRLERRGKLLLRLAVEPEQVVALAQPLLPPPVLELGRGSRVRGELQCLLWVMLDLRRGRAHGALSAAGARRGRPMRAAPSALRAIRSERSDRLWGETLAERPSAAGVAIRSSSGVFVKEVVEQRARESGPLGVLAQIEPIRVDERAARILHHRGGA